MTELTKSEQAIITKYDLYFEGRLTKAETNIENLNKTVAKIEVDIRDLRQDIRWVIGLMVSFSAIMIGMMARGFHWY